jgi:hypothetical protein
MIFFMGERSSKYIFIDKRIKTAPAKKKPMNFSRELGGG